jgi:hypothetical protein
MDINAYGMQGIGNLYGQKYINMKTLNKNGLEKLVEYINTEYNKKFIVNNCFIELDDKSEIIIEDLKKHNIILKEFSYENNLKKYSVIIEDTSISSVPEPISNKTNIDNSGKDYEDEKYMKEMIKQILPHLSQYFPTKEEINNALNDLRGQLVDPIELTNLFKDISLKIKKDQNKLSKTK